MPRHFHNRLSFISPTTSIRRVPSNFINFIYVAPIQPLDNDTTRLQERAHLYTKEDQENAGWVVLGILCGAAFFTIMYIMYVFTAL